MKKSVALIILLLSLFTAAQGVTAANEVKLITKFSLLDVQSFKRVILTDSKYSNIPIKAELVEGVLYIQADHALPFIQKWSYDPINQYEAVVFNDKVTVVLGPHVEISVQGKPVELTESMTAQLKRGYIPLRFCYEKAGYSVAYMESENSVWIFNP